LTRYEYALKFELYVINMEKAREPDGKLSSKWALYFITATLENTQRQSTSTSEGHLNLTPIYDNGMKCMVRKRNKKCALQITLVSYKLVLLGSGNEKEALKLHKFAILPG
jgi:hypothetical protein